MNFPYVCPVCGARVADEEQAIRVERTCPEYGEGCVLESIRDNEVPPQPEIPS